MSEFVNTVDVLGDEVLTNSIIDRSVTEYKDNVVKVISASAFFQCTSLVSVDVPNATSIGNFGFNTCTSLVSVNFPNVTTIGQSCFNDCPLTVVDLPKATDIQAYAFMRCKLTAVMLRSPTMCNISQYAFSGTPIAITNQSGYVYVPSSLKSDYEKSFSWMGSRFRALEDYTVDGTTTGALDPSKI